MLLLSLVVSLAALTLVSSRGAFSDPTDNLGNSFTATASFGAITQIQKASAGSAGSASSITASYGSTPVQDNLLVLVHHYRANGTVTLPAGWAQAVTEQQSGSRITIGYKIAGASEGTDITVTVSSSGQQTITIFEYSGIDTVSPLDQTASNAVGVGNPTSCSTGTTPTTTTADELLIAGVGLNGTSGAWADTWTSSFTQQSTVVSSGGLANQRSASSTADNIVSATGGYETTESWTTGRKCQAAIATFREPIPYAALSGTVTPWGTEAEVVTGGETLIITLSNDTWDATVGADNAITTALIAGIDSAGGEPAGWNNVVKTGLTFADVTRTSATVVTVTLPAFAGYEITANETITVTVPATAVASSGPITAIPTFTVAIPITQVQKTTAGTSGNASSITASYGSAPTQGNLLVLVHHYRNTGTVTLPGGWTQAVVKQSAGSKITIAYKIAGVAEGSDVTVSVSSADDQTITIFEYEGIETVSPLDQTASDVGSLTSCSTGTTPTTTTANQLLIAGVGLNGASGGWANTWTNGFTQQSTVVSTVSIDNQVSASSTAARIVVATGGYETTESWTTGRSCQAAIVTFQAP